MLALSLFLSACVDHGFRGDIEDDLACSPGSAEDPVDGMSLQDLVGAWQTNPPVVPGDWTTNVLDAADDALTLTPNTLTDVKTCVSASEGTQSSSATVTVDVASVAWLPSGTYTGEVDLYAPQASLGLSFEVPLPEEYRANARPALEDAVGRSLTDAEVPESASLTVSVAAFRASDEVDHMDVTVDFTADQLAPLWAASGEAEPLRLLGDSNDEAWTGAGDATE